MPTSKPMPTSAEILKRFPQLFTEAIGDTNVSITGVNSPEAATTGQMSFLATPKALNALAQSQASVLVVSPKAKDQADAKRGSRTILISPNPERAMAVVISEYYLKTPYTNPQTTSVHPMAFVDPSARVADTVRIGPNAFVGANVTLAANVYIGANAVVEANCQIGEETVIHPLAYIGHSTEIGKRCEVHPHAVIGKEGFGYAHDERFNHTRIPHQGRVVLGDDVHIGACCAIDRGTFGETRIESGVIMDNLVHIAHNNVIGRNSVLTSGFTMAGSSKIGANFVTGGKTVVAGHIEIADNVQVAALTAISKSLPVAGQYGGNPIQPLQSYLKTKAALAQLPQMRKKLQQIAKHLGLTED